jgi:hypothetical protein
MYGAGSGTIAICGWVQHVRLITLRTRRTVFTRSLRAAWRTGLALACLTILILRY